MTRTIVVIAGGSVGDSQKYYLRCIALAALAAVIGCGAPTAPVAATLAFSVQPSSTTVGHMLSPIQVEVEDATGARVANFQNAVTLALGTNPGSAVLRGTTTVNAVSGIATFSGLSLDKAGTGYTLVASVAGLTGATSGGFIMLPAIGMFTQVSEGDDQTCGLKTGGAAYCWGANGYGQIGNGTTNTVPYSVPVAVSGGLTFAAVSPSASSTCGLTTSGAVVCWGFNAYGQLGNGTMTNSSIPIVVSGGGSFASVSAGADITCGVTTSGAAYCWGYNAYGQLGDGTTTRRLTPVAVLGGLTFASVSAGLSFSTCGVTTAGAAYCWGDNSYGELGNGTTTLSASPVAVSGGLTFAAVSAGFAYACGVTTAGGGVCWGRNDYGQLGNGTTTNSSTPVAVSGGLTFATVSAGLRFTCGVTTAGAAYCWGLSAYGELGNGTTGISSTPVAVSGGLTFTGVSAGQDATCGVTTGGIAYCWGYNSQGQLGNNTRTNNSIPVAVAGQSGT